MVYEGGEAVYIFKLLDDYSKGDLKITLCECKDRYKDWKFTESWHFRVSCFPLIIFLFCCFCFCFGDGVAWGMG